MIKLILRQLIVIASIFFILNLPVLAQGDAKLGCDPIQEPFFNPTLKHKGTILPDTKTHNLIVHYIDDQDVVKKLVNFSVYILNGKIVVHDIIGANENFPINFLESLRPSQGQPGINVLPLKELAEDSGCKFKLIFFTLQFYEKSSSELATTQYDIVRQTSLDSSVDNFELVSYQDVEIPKIVNSEWVRIESDNTCPFSVQCNGLACGPDPFFNPNIRASSTEDGITDAEVNLYIGKYGDPNSQLVASYNALIHCGYLHLTELTSVGKCMTKELAIAMMPSGNKVGDPHGTYPEGINMATFAKFLGKCGDQYSYLTINYKKIAKQDRLPLVVVFQNPHNEIYRDPAGYDFSKLSGTAVIPSGGVCEGEIDGGNDDIKLGNLSCGCEEPSGSPSPKPSGKPGQSASPSATPSASSIKVMPSGNPSPIPSGKVGQSATPTSTPSAGSNIKPSSSPTVSPSTPSGGVACPRNSFDPKVKLGDGSQVADSKGHTLNVFMRVGCDAIIPDIAIYNVNIENGKIRLVDIIDYRADYEKFAKSLIPSGSQSGIDLDTINQMFNENCYYNNISFVLTINNADQLIKSCGDPRENKSFNVNFSNPHVFDYPEIVFPNDCPQADIDLNKSCETMCPYTQECECRYDKTSCNQTSASPSSTPSAQPSGKIEPTPTSTATPEPSKGAAASPSSTAVPAVSPGAGPSGKPTPIASEKPVPSESLNPSGPCNPGAEHKQMLALFDDRIKNYADRVGSALKSASKVAIAEDRSKFAKELLLMAGTAHDVGIRCWFLTWNGLDQAFCQNSEQVSTCVNDSYYSALDEINSNMKNLATMKRKALKVLKEANSPKYLSLKKSISKRYKNAKIALEKIETETKSLGRCN